MTNVIPQWHLSTSQVPSSYLIGQHGCGPFPPSQTASWTRMRADCHPWHPGVLPPGTAWPGFLSGTSIRTSRMPMSTTCCLRTSSSGPTTRSRWLPTTAPGWASTAAKSPSGRYREVSGDSGRCFSFSKVCACGILYSPSPNVGFPGGSDGKESTCLSGDLGFIPGSGRSLGEGNGNPLEYLCLGKSHGQRSLEGYSSWGQKELDTTERQSSSSTSPDCLNHVACFIQPRAIAPEKAMAPYSSTLAWKIPGMGEPGGLPSMGSHRVGHD